MPAVQMMDMLNGILGTELPRLLGKHRLDTLRNTYHDTRDTAGLDLGSWNVGRVLNGVRGQTSYVNISITRPSLKKPYDCSTLQPWAEMLRLDRCRAEELVIASGIIAKPEPNIFSHLTDDSSSTVGYSFEVGPSRGDHEAWLDGLYLFRHNDTICEEIRVALRSNRGPMYWDQWIELASRALGELLNDPSNRDPLTIAIHDLDALSEAAVRFENEEDSAWPPYAGWPAFLHWGLPLDEDGEPNEMLFDLCKYGVAMNCTRDYYRALPPTVALPLFGNKVYMRVMVP